MAAKTPRTESIRVMLTPDERAAFQAKAEEHGLSLSSAMRQLIMKTLRPENQ